MALDVMITAKCPAEIPAAENSNVKFFRDYETTSTGVSKAANAHDHTVYVACRGLFILDKK